MAINDLKVIKNGALPYTLEATVEDRTTSSLSATIKPGEPVGLSNQLVSFVVLLNDGEPQVGGAGSGETGTPTFMGIATKESTETSSADGKVEFWPAPFAMIRGKATTTTNVDTAAELLAILYDMVTFDYSTYFTIDENEGSDLNVHGLLIWQGDIAKYTLDVIVHPLCTVFAPLVGQTMD